MHFLRVPIICALSRMRTPFPLCKIILHIWCDCLLMSPIKLRSCSLSEISHIENKLLSWMTSQHFLYRLTLTYVPGVFLLNTSVNTVLLLLPKAPLWASSHVHCYSGSVSTMRITGSKVGLLFRLWWNTPLLKERFTQGNIQEPTWREPSLFMSPKAFVLNVLHNGGSM